MSLYLLGCVGTRVFKLAKLEDGLLYVPPPSLLAISANKSKENKDDGFSLS